MELTRCPECALVAEVVGRDVWPSTDGPVEHVHVRCVAGHRFLLPVAMLAANAPPGPVVAGGPWPRPLRASSSRDPDPFPARDATVT